MSAMFVAGQNESSVVLSGQRYYADLSDVIASIEATSEDGFRILEVYLENKLRKGAFVRKHLCLVDPETCDIVALARTEFNSIDDLALDDYLEEINLVFLKRPLEVFAKEHYLLCPITSVMTLH